jgi:hypothetical protein
VIKSAAADLVHFVHVRTSVAEFVQQFYSSLPGNHLEGRHLQRAHRMDVFIFMIVRHDLVRPVKIAVLDD